MFAANKCSDLALFVVKYYRFHASACSALSGDSFGAGGQSYQEGNLFSTFLPCLGRPTGQIDRSLGGQDRVDRQGSERPTWINRQGSLPGVALAVTCCDRFE